MFKTEPHMFYQKNSKHTNLYGSIMQEQENLYENSDAYE
jgi:hypothetical protein